VLDIAEITAIFKAAYHSKNLRQNNTSYGYFESLRNIVVLELLFTTGARVSEIAGLREQQINFNSGTIIIRGKGNKERIIQVCNKEAITAVRNYYRLYQVKISTAENHFLINRFGDKLSDQSIRNIVEKPRKLTLLPNSWITLKKFSIIVSEKCR
jgi:integrase/recombinase XerD